MGRVSQRVRAGRGPMTGSARLRARRPGHPRPRFENRKDVDGRDKHGDDDHRLITNTPSLIRTFRTSSSS